MMGLHEQAQYHLISHVLVLITRGKKALKDGHLVCSYKLKENHSKKQDETLQCKKNHWQLWLINNHHSSSDADEFTFSCTF
jgi:hypothetical protein